MKKDQLSKKIEEQFQQESEKVVDSVTSEEKHSKMLRLIISIIMSVVVLASLAYSLLESIGK